MERDLEFYMRRAIEERRAADRSLPPDARKIHLDQAELYVQMACEAADAQRNGEQGSGEQAA